MNDRLQELQNRLSNVRDKMQQEAKSTLAYADYKLIEKHIQEDIKSIEKTGQNYPILNNLV